MAQYMLCVWYPADAVQPAPDELERIVDDVDTVHRQLRDEGSWVFGGGLHDPTTATVVTSKGGRAVTESCIGRGVDLGDPRSWKG